jgi:hypothetical protein
MNELFNDIEYIFEEDVEHSIWPISVRKLMIIIDVANRVEIT